MNDIPTTLARGDEIALQVAHEMLGVAIQAGGTIRLVDLETVRELVGNVLASNDDPCGESCEWLA